MPETDSDEEFRPDSQAAENAQMSRHDILLDFRRPQSQSARIETPVNVPRSVPVPGGVLL